jgi:ABC-2 type transport system ATP-binding protein
VITIKIPAIITTELYKKYGSLKALNGVSFTVDKGSIFGLLGPNGAGKTTTIRIMTGLTRPDTGSVSIMEHDINTDTIEAKKKIGIVPEMSNIYEEMTAEQNLVFAAELYGVPYIERRKRATELLKDFGLAERGQDLVVGFSRGMKRRLTIACGMVHRPEILILDEPTTGLDVQSALALREQVRKLNREGTTILLTTHYLEEADQLCDTIAMINRGRIVALDSPENLKASVTGDRVVEISFSAATPEAELERLPGIVEVYRLGDKYRFSFAGEGDSVSDIVEYARNRGLRVATINTLKPSLEDAFLKITGTAPDEVSRDKEQPRQRRMDE